MPVPGDWVTIAVVAERGPIKYSKAPVTITKDENDIEAKSKGKSKDKTTEHKPSGKKYVNMRLIDFGSRSSSSATGGRRVIRGDAYLSLLLFEADGCDVITGDDGSKKKLYRGGSKGAFEVMSKVKEGDVIALLNPKVLKPFQVSICAPVLCRVIANQLFQ